ncbi:replicative DNA helicase [Marinobacter salsuginis]|uniref:replicative DNA helicase n=1 Tax=Marinobacter salsuginis TaxID=418719 RepID=UPI00273FE6AD|nr:replicative DNA helicase [Marinobacter salsuginis]
MSIQAEQSVLFAVLTDSSRMKECDLEPHEFSDWHHQEAFSAARDIVNQGEIADLVTVCEVLEKRVPGVDFAKYLAGVLENAFCGSAFGQYVEIVHKSFRKRQALNIAQTLKTALSEGQDGDPVDTAIQQLMSLNQLGRNYDHDMKSVMAAGLRMIDEAMDADGIIGVPSGLRDLDECLGGFHDTDLIVIGARPAMGKTAFMLNLALAAGQPVGVISAEQGHEQMGLRLISIEGKLDSQKIRTGGFYDEEWDSLRKAVTRLTDKPIRVNDEPGMKITSLVRQARDWKYRYNIGALYVDYLQRIGGTDPRSKPTDRVSEVARSLKNLARELEIPVVALAQVSRECEKRPNKRPMNSDLADASEIEKEADEILFLYRDEVYNPETPDKGIAEIDISKNRHGPTGLVRCVFTGKFMRFDQLAPKTFQEQYGGSA